MKLPRDLSGEHLISRLCSVWDYSRINQEGSHVILETTQPLNHRISVPAHKVLRVGILNSILRSVSRHKGVNREAILETL